jgi:hypothetical protein
VVADQNFYKFSSDIPPNEAKKTLDGLVEKVQEVKRENEGCSRARGAEIWLVPTFKGIGEWKPVAVRKLDKEEVEWVWET